MKKIVFDAIIRNMIPLSKHSYGSHVIEKALKAGDDKQIYDVCEKVIGTTRGNENNLKTTLYDVTCDKYGNYVVQKILEHCLGSQRQYIVNVLQSVSDQIRGQQNYSRHVYKFIENDFKFIPEQNNSGSLNNISAADAAKKKR